MKRFTIVWGSLITILLLGFNLFGWSMTSTNRVLAEKTVRSNPGSYRTHYTGGK
jgi:hypothetical protein